MYVTECPQCTFIPIYLILIGRHIFLFVFPYPFISSVYRPWSQLFCVRSFFVGIFGIINQIASYRIHRKTTDILEDHSKDSIILRLTFILLFVTFGLGSYWIFKLFQPNYDRNVDAEEYCDKFVYLFAFSVTISIYIVSFGVPLARFLLTGIKRMILKQKRENGENVQNQPVNVINIVWQIVDVDDDDDDGNKIKSNNKIIIRNRSENRIINVFCFHLISTFRAHHIYMYICTYEYIVHRVKIRWNLCIQRHFDD